VTRENLNTSEYDEFSKQNGFAGWYLCLIIVIFRFETSAKESSDGIDRAAKFLIQKILENTFTAKPKESGLVNIKDASASPQQPAEKKGPCCK
jgi:hypothetical protein